MTYRCQACRARIKSARVRTALDRGKMPTGCSAKCSQKVRNSRSYAKKKEASK
jgi:hypothetical protein